MGRSWPEDFSQAWVGKLETTLDVSTRTARWMRHSTREPVEFPAQHLSIRWPSQQTARSLLAAASPPWVDKLATALADSTPMARRIIHSTLAPAASVVRSCILWV